MAAGKQSPSGAQLLVDGYNMLASTGTSPLSFEEISEISETTGVGMAARTRAPKGITSVTLEQQGAFWDTATNSIHDALATKLGSSPTSNVRIVCAGFAGNEENAPIQCFEGGYNNRYKVIGSDDDLQKVDVEYAMNGNHDPAIILQPLAAKTATWNTEASSFDYTADISQIAIPITSSSVANPSVITTTVAHGLTTGDKVLISGHSGATPSINAEQVATVVTTTTFTIPVNVTVGGTGGSFVRADSAGGGVGYLQVTAASGFTNFVGKIRDSTDDISFADVLSFADNVSAPFAERVTVAGDIDRYLSVTGTLTGSGSLTSLIAFARS